MKQTMMAKKYWSMLLAGTVYMSIATALVMSGSVIAGVMVGQDAVSGINLVTPLFCAATFLGSLFSIGVPILYSKEMGAFNKQKADQAFRLGLGMTALLGLAIGPIVSLYLSEGVFGGARKIYGLAKRTCVAEGAFLCLAFNIFAPSVPAILGISDSETASLAILCARLISLGYAFTGCLYLASCYYLMREKIKLSFMICCLRDALVSIPAATLAGFFWGPRGMFAGLAAAPFLAAGISALIVRLKYGKAEYPLLITELEKKQKYLWLEFDVVPNEIVRIRDEAEAALKARGYGGKFVNRVMTLIEEVFMYVYDKNAGKKVQAECALIMKDGAVEIIEKNNGTVIDFADADMPADSFRAFFTNSIIKGYSLRPRHLIALSCNRNVFRVEERD